jgi:hypothetical protein
MESPFQDRAVHNFLIFNRPISKYLQSIRLDWTRGVVHWHYCHARKSPTRISAKWGVPGPKQCIFALEIMTNTIGDGGKITAGQGRDGIGYAAVNIVIYYYITLCWGSSGSILQRCHYS